MTQIVQSWQIFWVLTPHLSCPNRRVESKLSTDLDKGKHHVYDHAVSKGATECARILRKAGAFGSLREVIRLVSNDENCEQLAEILDILILCLRKHQLKSKSRKLASNGKGKHSSRLLQKKEPLSVQSSCAKPVQKTQLLIWPIS